jgi:dTDP-4-amino-4,6-dideoxygalactose transaminase
MKSCLKIPSNKHWTAAPQAQLEVQQTILRVLANGNFTLGSEVESFEREFSAFTGVPGLGVGSGTDAITLALTVGGIGPGDEVLLPTFAPAGTIAGVLCSGATPVLVDITSDFELDLKMAEQSITKNTRAVVCVHLFGRMENMWGINQLANLFNLWVVEDCAHAHGAMLLEPGTQTWWPAGSIGDAAAFSFYPTKNLGACGDAGFCGSKHTELLPRLAALRQYGWTRRDHAEILGRNSRLDEIQAGILRVGLRSLLERNHRRRANASAYHKLLQGSSAHHCTLPPQTDPARILVFHQYVLQSDRRDALISHLQNHGIGYGIHYPPLHTQPAFRRYGGERAFAAADDLGRRVVSLPMFPELSNTEIEIVCETLNTF